MNSNWQHKTLSEVCIIKPPKSEAKRILNEADFVSFVPMENMGINQKFFNVEHKRTLGQVVGSYTYFAEGDVLLAKITPCFENGKLGIAKNLVNGIGFGSSEYLVFRPTELLNNEYLYYFLSREVFREEGAKCMSGAVGHKRVSKEFIENTIISIPSVSEQQRIVLILDETFEGLATSIANTEKNLRSARELFSSELQIIFDEGGDGWNEGMLQDLVENDCSLSYGIVQPGDEYPDGLPVVRPTDLNQKVIQLDGLKLIDPILANGYKRSTLRGSDLLLCVRGSTGMVSIAAEELAGANVTRGIVPIRFDSRFISQSFGYYALISNHIQKQIKVKTYGTALMQINIGDLRKITTRYPDLTTQHHLVEKLDSLLSEVMNLERAYQQKLDALTELKKSILHQAFSGQLQ